MQKIINNPHSVDDLILIKGLKESLHAGEISFGQLFNSTHLPQWIYDSVTLRFLLVNDAAINQYGYSKKEFLNMTILEIVPYKERQKLILYNEFLKTTNEPFSAVNQYLKKNMHGILMETTSVNINYKSHNCVLASCVDITEKMKLEEKISSMKVTRQQKITQATINGQEKEREEIGRELHDNINQLLTATKLYMEIARSNEELRIDFIGRGEKILEKAIREIRVLSNSLVLPTLKDIGFKDSLNELFEVYQLTNTFNIHLTFDDEAENLEKEMQITLFRIIQEQLNNILKHANAQNITINVAVNGHLSLLIKDDGRGFDSTKKHKGAGIPNIRNRVELYNGTVKIISKPLAGCTLLIDIPSTSQTRGSKNILIVEDDPDDQEVIMRAFADVAPIYNITCLNDGKELVDHLQSYPDKNLPCLIVLDYNMPLLNGLETLKILEVDARFNKIPKIIYSNSSLNYYKNLCYSANAKAYITKGITIDEIKENILEMLAFVIK